MDIVDDQPNATIPFTLNNFQFGILEELFISPFILQLWPLGNVVLLDVLAISCLELRHYLSDWKSHALNGQCWENTDGSEQFCSKSYGKLSLFSQIKVKGWLAIATLKPTFTFFEGILPSKSIEYGKIPTKKSESWF